MKVCPPIVSVPLRSSGPLAVAVNPTVPLPVPDAPVVTVSHGAFAVAVHVQLGADAVTVTAPDPPPFGIFCEDGEIEMVHGGGGAAACDTVNVCPPIVIVPVRAAPVFAAAVNATVPLPVPDDDPLLTVNHGAFATAVHAHVGADAVTATDPEPPVSATFCDAGAIVNVHGGAGGADCDTVNVCPAIVIVPLRAAPVLAAAANATVPLPVPDAPLVTVSHDALAAAVHAHMASDAVIATDPEPPVSVTL